MGFEMLHNLGPFSGRMVANPRTQHETPRQRAEPGGNMHGAGAREIIHAQLVQPAVGIPLKVCEHVVHERRPAQ